MIDGRSVLAIIPARGGSKGVPRKNVRDVGGKPLLAWTINAANASAYIDRLILSSDDPEIIAAAKDHGCEVPFVRPASLAADDTPGTAPVLHALEAVPGYDVVVLLQATSPLRTQVDIDGCLRLFVDSGCKSCVSVTEAGENPHWMYSLARGGELRPLLEGGPAVARRQDLPKTYLLNGAVYVSDARWFATEQTFLPSGVVGYVMPAERSLDIDTELDMALASLLLESIHGKA